MVTLPLVLLSIPAVCAGWLIGSVVHGGYFGPAIFVANAHDWIPEMAREYHGVFGMMLHGLTSLPFWLAIAGVALAWYLYILRPEVPAVLRAKFAPIVTILERKYGLDDFNQAVFAGGAVRLGNGLWKWGDRKLIDGLLVNGSANLVGWVAGVVRWFQTGFIYSYAFSMIFGVMVLLTLFAFYVHR